MKDKIRNYGFVSIITPNYNCGRFIAQTIESIQRQTYKNWELLIQDDCSTDDSLMIAMQYVEKDSRIKLQCNVKKMGAAITRNNALKRAKGDFIAFLDSDDLWLPNKLEEQLAFMTSNGYNFTYHGYSEIDENNHYLGVKVSGKKKIGVVGMYLCCWPGCLSVMYNAKKVGLIQIDDVKKNNDTALWLKIIKKSNCYYLNKNLAEYRRRKGSITPPSLIQRIGWHYRLFRNAERMGPISSFVLMSLNVIGNTYKKLFYVKKE